MQRAGATADGKSVHHGLILCPATARPCGPASRGGTMTTRPTRREFTNGITLSAAAAILGISPSEVDAEPPPETTRLRLARMPFDHACLAPQWIAEELLRAEGFSDIRYTTSAAAWDDLAAGRIDFSGIEIMGLLLSLDAGQPIVALGGLHAGCFELF